MKASVTSAKPGDQPTSANRSEFAGAVDRLGTEWRGGPDRVKVDPRPVICGARRDLPMLPRSAAFSPATGAVLAVVAECGQDIIEIAVDSARRAFDRGDWRRMPSGKRASLLHRWADLMDAHVDELAMLLAMETGNPVAQCRDVDLASVLGSIRRHAVLLADTRRGRTDTPAPAFLGKDWDSVGVVAVVTPSSGPMLPVSHEALHALVQGSSVLIKPALQASLAILQVAELGNAAGLPRGALAVLTGGDSTTECLARQSGIDVLRMTDGLGLGNIWIADDGDTSIGSAARPGGRRQAHALISSQ